MSKGAPLSSYRQYYFVRWSARLQQLLTYITAAMRRCRNISLGQRYEWSLRHRYANEKLPGTCGWLSQEESYCRWTIGHGVACLWICGQPGAGKTMLCSSIVDDLLQTEQGKNVVTFFLSNEAFSGIDSALYLLDSFICQLVRKERQIASRSMLLSIQKSIDITGSPVSANTFRQHLVTILDTLDPQARLLVVLDGLQTDEWITSALVYEILEANVLRNKSNHIRCIVTSKTPHSVIAHHHQVVSIDLGCQTGVQRDMYVFAKARLASYPQPMTDDDTLLEKKARQLCLRANGSFLWIEMFVWVEMVTDNQERTRDLEKVLKDVDALPSSLQGLYAVMLRTVPAERTHIAQTVFSWLLAGNRPLNLGELLEALIIQSDWHRASVSEVYAMERLGIHDLTTGIPRICGGLVCTSRNLTFLLGIEHEPQGIFPMHADLPALEASLVTHILTSNK